MGLNFTQLWACLVCGVVLVGTVAGILYNRGETINVRVGAVVIEDAGVQP